MTANELLGMRGEAARKGLHLLSLALPVSMVVLPYGSALTVLTALSAIAISAEIARDRSASVHARIDRWFGWMMRPGERAAGGGFCGATWVVVTAALLLAAFPAPVAATAMAVGLVGDAAAALAGRAIGRHPWPGSGRTVEGTAGFILAGVLVVAVAGTFPWEVRLASVVAAAVIEAAPLPVNDNLAVPFAAAAVLAVLG